MDGDTGQFSSDNYINSSSSRSDGSSIDNHSLFDTDTENNAEAESLTERLKTMFHACSCYKDVCRKQIQIHGVNCLAIMINYHDLRKRKNNIKIIVGTHGNLNHIPSTKISTEVVAKVESFLLKMKKDDGEVIAT
ncbi:hypothetical protein HOY82DRAFT_537448 [Tuber indicum]|nr:hypothetical protein HOY82DRAFT_537448 [Tuber indicum]